MARMKVLTSLIGTTRPIRQSTGGGWPGAGAQRGEQAERDAVGECSLVRRAVGHLAQAVGFVEGDDGIGGVVAEAAQPLEKADPHLPEIGESVGSRWKTLRLSRIHSLLNRSILRSLV